MLRREENGWTRSSRPYKKSSRFRQYGIVVPPTMISWGGGRSHQIARQGLSNVRVRCPWHADRGKRGGREGTEEDADEDCFLRLPNRQVWQTSPSSTSIACAQLINPCQGPDSLTHVNSQRPCFQTDLAGLHTTSPIVFLTSAGIGGRIQNLVPGQAKETANTP